jgi:DNA gyrase/topoisomerase IV subunit B
MWQKGEAKSGKDPKKVKSVDKDVMALLKDKKHSKYGTIVAWTLDQTVVSADVQRGKKLPKNYRHAAPDPAQLGSWLRNMSMLNPGLEVRLTLIKKGKRKEFTFHNKKDLAHVVKTMVEERELGSVGKPFIFDNLNASTKIKRRRVVQVPEYVEIKFKKTASQ